MVVWPLFCLTQVGNLGSSVCPLVWHSAGMTCAGSSWVMVAGVEDVFRVLHSVEKAAVSSQSFR